jgi:superfamily II DNA or RNA helicase
MIHLELGNSECSITGLSIQQHKELKDILSYTLNPTARFFGGGYGPRKQSLLSTKGKFPTGLLYLVEKYLLDKRIDPYSEHDNRRIPEAIEGLFTLSLGVTPYKEQIEAAKACKAATRGIVVAPTGVGKSLIISLIINELQVPTLIVVPSLELKRQLTKSLKEAFGDDKIGKNQPIYVQNVDGIQGETLTKVYDCVIIDEFHHSGAKTYRSVNKKSWDKVFYKFGLTATPFRSQDHERLLLESVLSNVIYEIDYQNAVNSDYIVPLEAYYVEVPRDNMESNSWPKVYSERIVNNHIRNKMIARILLMLSESGKSTLCLVKEIKHGEILKDLISGYFANGVSEDTPWLIKLFNESKLKTLIGTTGILGEGVDTKPCEYVVIAGLGKSKNAFMQQVGRAFRKSPGKESAKIIVFFDRSHKFTRDHYKAQCKHLLEEYGVVPSKLNIFD